MSKQKNKTAKTLIMLGTFLLLYLFFTAVYLVIMVIMEDSVPADSFFSVSLLGQLVVVELLPVFLVMLIFSIKFKEAFPFRKVSGKNIFYSIILLICLMPSVSLVNMISLTFSENQILNTILDYDVKPLQLLIIVGVLAPIVEEMMFRGLLVKITEKGSLLFICLFNGFLFGVFHGNLNQFCYAFILGSLFTYLVKVTGSLTTSTILHIGFNSINCIFIIASMSAGATSSTSTSLDTSGIPGGMLLPILVLSIFSAIGIYFFIRVNEKFVDYNEDNPNSCYYIQPKSDLETIEG